MLADLLARKREVEEQIEELLSGRPILREMEAIHSRLDTLESLLQKVLQRLEKDESPAKVDYTPKAKGESPLKHTVIYAVWGLNIPVRKIGSHRVLQIRSAKDMIEAAKKGAIIFMTYNHPKGWDCLAKANGALSVKIDTPVRIMQHFAAMQMGEEHE